MRIGYRKKIGKSGLYVSSSVNTKKMWKGLISIFLIPFYILYYVCVWPFIAIYKAVTKNGKTKASAGNGETDAPHSENNSKKPTTKRWWLWPVIAVIAISAVIGSTGSDKKDEKQDIDQNSVDAENNDQLEDKGDPVVSGEITSGDGKYTLPCGIELQFWDEVQNDVTGNWRRAATSDSLAPAEYALEYYNEMFHSDDEVHAIWNATLKTTTRITYSGGLLFVDTFEYVDGEEHDAKILFSGPQLDSRIIDIATGKPYEKPDEVDKAGDGTPAENVGEETDGKDIQDGLDAVGADSNFNTYDNQKQQETSATYVLNTHTMKFHYPSCNSVPKISPENYGTYTGTRDQAIENGYSPCGKCNP